MQQCPNCGHPNRAGVVFCENCGASLIGKMPLDTKSLNTTTSPDEQSPGGIDSHAVTDTKVQGTSTFNAGDALKLNIEGSPEPIVFEPKEEAIFGRRDPATGAMPDVDLTPFAGYRMGVSRRHAAIRKNDEKSLDLWDLGSSNGTFLNGQRLTAHRPYRLHDGDELRLGQMMIRINFEPKKDVPEEAPATAAQTASAPGGDDKPAEKQPDTAQPPEKPASAQSPASAEHAEQQAPKPVPPSPKTEPVQGAMHPNPPPTSQTPSETPAEQAPETEQANNAKPGQAQQEQAETSQPEKTDAPDEESPAPPSEPDSPASQEEKRD